MSISSIASSTVQAALQPPTNSNERVEGNTPDGDGDRDDRSQSTTVTANVTKTQTTGSIGSNINVVA